MTENSQELKQKNERDLVTASLANRDAFLDIVKLYEKPLSSYIKRLTRVDEDELQDILQEVFIKTYLNLNEFNSDLKFSSWIYRIAHNHVISRYRKLKARPEGNAINIDEEGLKNLADGIDIAIQTDLNLASEEINKILNLLEEKYREVLVLKFLEEKSYEEISDILKKPAGTVASMINRAKLAFKAEAEKQKIKF